MISVWSLTSTWRVTSQANQAMQPERRGRRIKLRSCARPLVPVVI